LLSIDYVLIVVLLISIYTDLRFQKIYNVVIFPAVLFALGYHLAIGGAYGILFSHTSLQT
jgi:prepilin peptidase CpaA